MREVTVEEVKDLVLKLYKKGHRDSVIMLGPPGIGKSFITREIAKEISDFLGREFIELDYYTEEKVLGDKNSYFVLKDFRLVFTEPSDIVGIPRVIKGAVDYIPQRWSIIMSMTPGVLFLDEITNVTRGDVLSVTYPILNMRKVWNIPLHEDSLVIAAGNSPEDSTIANPLPQPIINRAIVFKVKPPTVDQWIEYMHKYVKDFDRRVIGFLKKFSVYFMKLPEDPDSMEPFPTPRSWDRLARVIKDLDIQDIEKIAPSYIGTEAAAHLCSFLKIKIPDASRIIANPSIFDELNIEQKYFAITVISNQIHSELENEKFNLQKYKKFLLHLFSGYRDLLVLLIFLMPKEKRIELSDYLDEDSETEKITDYIIELHKKISEVNTNE